MLPQSLRPRVLASMAGGWLDAKFFHGPTYRLIAAVAELDRGDDLLDVACGPGMFLSRYAEHVRGVCGLDISQTQVAMARRRLGDRIAAGTAQLVVGDAVSLPWPDATFSIVTCMGSVELFADPQAALNEMRRVLRPGGRVALTMGANVDPADTGKWARLGWSVWTEADVHRMMREAGFGAVSISYGRWGGDSRLLGFLIRLMTGTDEGRFVHAVKPPGRQVDDGIPIQSEDRAGC